MTAKNRTSTLSPSTTRTTSCSTSLSSAVSPPVAISSRPASSEAHPSQSQSVSEVSLANHNARRSTSGAASQERSCCIASAHQKPPVPLRSTRITHRRRSLSAEEEIRTIGCFNLKPAPNNNNNNNYIKSKILNGGKTTSNVEKPTWLQICDPCHRILERSLTPDAASDVGLVQRCNNSSVGRDKVQEREPVKSVDLELSDLRFIDSTSAAGDLHQWAQSEKEQLSGNYKQEVIVSEWPTVSVSGSDGRKGKQARTVKKSIKDSASNPDWEYLDRGRGDSNSNGGSDNKKKKKSNGVDELIINNKVFGRFGGEPLHHHHPQQQQKEVDSVVANNNLGEKAEQRRVVVVTRSRRSDHRQPCLTINGRVEGETEATQLPQHLPSTKDVFCDDPGQGDAITGTGSEAVSVRDSFEEDYERCIESINRQLQLESRDAACRRTAAGDVTLIGPEVNGRTAAEGEEEVNIDSGTCLTHPTIDGRSE